MLRDSCAPVYMMPTVTPALSDANRCNGWIPLFFVCAGLTTEQSRADTILACYPFSGLTSVGRRHWRDRLSIGLLPFVSFSPVEVAKDMWSTRWPVDVMPPVLKHPV